MLIINGTRRKDSLSSKIVDYIMSKFSDKVKSVYTMKYNSFIPDTYLSGTDENLKYDHKSVVLVLASYYVMPPAAFLNWINRLSQTQLMDLFADKTVFIISAQGEGNLNEVPVNIIRTLLIKIFDYNNIEARICIKHCMVNSANIEDGRIDTLLSKYIC